MDMKKIDNKRTDETLHELSVNSILMEMSDINTGDMEFSVEDILAEFKSEESENGKVEEVSKPDIPETDIPETEISETDISEQDLSGLAGIPAEYDEKSDSDNAKREEMPVNTPVEISVTGVELKQDKVSADTGKPGPKKITKIIKPWDDGIYGDTKVIEGIKDKSKKDDYHQLSFKEVVPEYDIPDTIEEYSAVFEKKRNKYRGRTIVCFLLCIPLIYMSFYSVMGWYMPDIIAYINNPFRFLFLTVMLQCLVMLTSLDIIAGGFARLFKLKPNLDTTLAFSNLVTLTHTVMIMLKPQWGGWLPYSSITSFALALSLYGGYLRENARLRSCRAALAVKNPSCVVINESESGTFVHKVDDADIKAFLRHLYDTDASESFWSYLSPITIVATLVFAAAASFGNGDAHNFFWAAAAICSVTVPFSAALAYTLPYAKIAKHLSGIGAVISGWYSASMFRKGQSVTLRDGDLFPKGTIILHGMKMLGNYPLEKILTYAASMINESKSGLKSVFNDLLSSQFGRTVKVERLKYHEAGGMEAEINGDTVLMGTAGFMFRMGIRVHENVNVKNAVFIAVNMELAGVFNVNYKINHEIRRSLISLIRKKVTPVLAAIDFNLTPVMLESEFKLPVGSLEYPEVEDRIYLANVYMRSELDPAALVTRSGLPPYTGGILSAMRLKKVTIRNIVLTALCAGLGMTLMFYLAFTKSMESAAPNNVFLYLLLWYVPMYLLSLRVKRY